MSTFHFKRMRRLVNCWLGFEFGWRLDSVYFETDKIEFLRTKLIRCILLGLAFVRFLLSMRDSISSGTVFGKVFIEFPRSFLVFKLLGFRTRYLSSKHDLGTKCTCHRLGRAKRSIQPCNKIKIFGAILFLTFASGFVAHPINW